jgi:malate dehydrogenase (oxaloacetate-decarboxylating)(NADP+)
MFLAAARALAATVSRADLADGSLFPRLESIRTTSAIIATAVIKVAVEEGLATAEIPADVQGWVTERMYQPVYRPIPQERRKSALATSHASES